MSGKNIQDIQALQDLKVLDLTRVVAGPYAGSILGDFGAEVLKIEIPGRGDDARAYGPYENGESMYYANLNRNKKGITLNLKTERSFLNWSRMLIFCWKIIVRASWINWNWVMKDCMRSILI